MMSLFKNTKIMGGIVVAAVLAFVAYYYWGGSAPAAPVVAPEEAPVASQELLTTLGNLRSIHLDPSLFADPLFATLSDFGVTIPPQPAGRRNPFAPIGIQDSQ